MNMMIDAATMAPSGEQPVEMVERKGVGHPDTICDAIAVVFLRLTPEKDRSPESIAPEAEQTARREIAQIPSLWQEIINGDVTLF